MLITKPMEAVRAKADSTGVQSWIEAAADAAVAKKGERTVILEVGDISGITDAFVITSGSNDRQVRSISDEIQERVRKAGGPRPTHTEGLDDARWILLDYGDFVVNIFLEEAREYYNLERLWSDVPRIQVADGLPA